MNKYKAKPSGPAIFMYCVIALTGIVAFSCLTLYYTDKYRLSVVLWTGVTCLTIMYHLWLRIIMGNVTKLLKIEYSMPWFKEYAFEKKLYSFLRVKSWKGKALTYNPELFSLKHCTLRDIANTMCKAEIDHVINIIISLTTLFFALIWGQLWIFLLTAFLAVLFDSQFIVIQRYNRPRLLRLISRRENHKAKKLHNKSK